MNPKQEARHTGWLLRARHKGAFTRWTKELVQPPQRLSEAPWRLSEIRRKQLVLNLGLLTLVLNLCRSIFWTTGWSLRLQNLTIQALFDISP